MTTPIYQNTSYRGSAWWVNAETPPLILAKGQPVSVDCAFPTSGISSQRPDLLMDNQGNMSHA